ncbi:iron-sulfur cluster repair di-iron protein [Ammoniphilus sp. CFH 90114]|uniref:iron-sulfur cluster repair di-iron protein n=1 Tax=Ammoniphilus sp. CFH 90114 TaxID=2493665 RepID=UPI00100E03CE|nr:iron-sulfur cluster repair di-iron protein [Ammoniphilus sp. CFH 90114]RXT07978.1 iron-sulfur cluster repair di-iron protein [Ammoniphilus sp. CFH 90114]
MLRFDRATHTGEIVIQVPQASSILKKYRIDFCCGGNRPIGQVLDEKNLNSEDILEQLNTLALVSQAPQEDKDWTQASYHETINHILQTHHTYLSQQLPEISPYVTKILRVHGSDRPELEELHTLFHKLKKELEDHTKKEEELIFPAILEYESSPTPERLAKLRDGIYELENEHEGAGHILFRMREITKDYTPPEGACMTYQLTFKKLEELETDTFAHVHLENYILFPRVLNAK